MIRGKGVGIFLETISFRTVPAESAIMVTEWGFNAIKDNSSLVEFQWWRPPPHPSPPVVSELSPDQLRRVGGKFGCNNLIAARGDLSLTLDVPRQCSSTFPCSLGSRFREFYGAYFGPVQQSGKRGEMKRWWWYSGFNYAAHPSTRHRQIGDRRVRYFVGGGLAQIHPRSCFIAQRSWPSWRNDHRSVSVIAATWWAKLPEFYHTTQHLKVVMVVDLYGKTHVGRSSISFSRSIVLGILTSKNCSLLCSPIKRSSVFTEQCTKCTSTLNLFPPANNKFGRKEESSSTKKKTPTNQPKDWTTGRVLSNKHMFAQWGGGYPNKQMRLSCSLLREDSQMDGTTSWRDEMMSKVHTRTHLQTNSFDELNSSRSLARLSAAPKWGLPAAQLINKFLMVTLLPR